jgi:hypothetical protein
LKREEYGLSNAPFFFEEKKKGEREMNAKDITRFSFLPVAYQLFPEMDDELQNGSLYQRCPYSTLASISSLFFSSSSSSSSSSSFPSNHYYRQASEKTELCDGKEKLFWLDQTENDSYLQIHLYSFSTGQKVGFLQYEKTSHFLKGWSFTWYDSGQLQSAIHHPNGSCIRWTQSGAYSHFSTLDQPFLEQTTKKKEKEKAKWLSDYESLCLVQPENEKPVVYSVYDYSTYWEIFCYTQSPQYEPLWKRVYQKSSKEEEKRPERKDEQKKEIKVFDEKEWFQTNPSELVSHQSWLRWSSQTHFVVFRLYDPKTGAQKKKESKIVQKEQAFLHGQQMNEKQEYSYFYWNQVVDKKGSLFCTEKKDDIDNPKKGSCRV